MKGLINHLTGKHEDKRITINAPRKYFETNNQYFALDRFLKDNDSDCLLYMPTLDPTLSFERCIFDYAPTDSEQWNVNVTDWDGKVDGETVNAQIN